MLILPPSLRGRVWRTCPLTSLRWRRWDDDWVVFNAGSGQTHLLDALAAVTLLCIEALPGDLASLIDQAAVELDLPAGEALSDALVNRLESLMELGLIEPTGP